MPNLSANQTEDMKGIAILGTYSGTNKACIQSLIDLVKIDSAPASFARGHLDQISPVARIQLFVELEALYAAVENV